VLLYLSPGLTLFFFCLGNFQYPHVFRCVFNGGVGLHSLCFFTGVIYTYFNIQLFQKRLLNHQERIQGDSGSVHPLRNDFVPLSYEGLFPPKFNVRFYCFGIGCCYSFAVPSDLYTPRPPKRIKKCPLTWGCWCNALDLLTVLENEKRKPSHLNNFQEENCPFFTLYTPSLKQSWIRPWSHTNNGSS
jgi:hypothetical protein